MISDTPQFITLLSSAARTATTTSSAVQIASGQTITCHLNITVASGTGGLTFRIEMQDPISGNWFWIATDGAARTTATNYQFQVGPGSSRVGGMTTAAFYCFQAVLTGPIRIGVAHGDATSYTYSVTASIA